MPAGSVRPSGSVSVHIGSSGRGSISECGRGRRRRYYGQIVGPDARRRRGPIRTDALLPELVQQGIHLPEGLVQFMQDQRGMAKVKDNKIVVRRDWTKESDKIKGAFAIARDLAEKVVEKKKANRG